jgi:ABC-2 type transport system ATP-binding protein
MPDINLTVESLNYKLHKKPILDQISFELNGAQAISVLGPNAAGKSTLLKCLATQLLPQSGTVLFNRINCNTQRGEYLSHIGYMPEKAVVMAELTAYEQLRLMADLQRVKQPEQSIQDVIEMCQLEEVLKLRTQHLSLGFKQRLNLAQALLKQPDVLILDEPLNGLDPLLVIEFRNIIQQLKSRCLIIMSTHYLAEAEIVSDRVLMIEKGCLLDDIDMKNSSEDMNLEAIYLQHMKKIKQLDVSG